LAVRATVGAVVHVNVSVPAPCAEQYTPAAAHAAMDAGAGAIITSLDALTADALTVAVVPLHALAGMLTACVV
jgi:hypothetical protein